MLIEQWVLCGLVVLLAIPAGIIIAKGTKEELKAGRNYFFALMLLSFIALVMSLFLKIDWDERVLIISSMLFIFIISGISYEFSCRKRR